MRRRFLRILAIFTFRWAWLLLPLLVLLTGAALWRTGQMTIDTSLEPFLPAEVQNHPPLGEIISDYRKLEPVLVVIHARTPGQEHLLTEAADLMAEWLNYRLYFYAPVYKADQEAQSFYESLSDLRLIQLLTPDDWATLERQLSQQLSAERLKALMAYRSLAFLPRALVESTRKDPFGVFADVRERLASSRGPTRLAPHNGYFFSADKRAVAILVYPVRSPSSALSAIETLKFLENCRESLLERHPEWQGQLTIDFAGSMVDSARQIRGMRADAKLILSFVVPLAMLLILLVFRKLEAVFFILLPPLAGLIWTLGLAEVAYGGISLVTAAVLIVILAIGLQYNVHLYHRFVVELYRNHNYYRALARSYVETGRGVLASAVVIAILFFLLVVTSLPGVEGGRDLLASRGFGRLGILAGVGILFNLAACLVCLPLFAAIKARLARGVVKPAHLYRFGLETFYEPAIANPRAMLGVMLLVCVFFGFQAQRLDFYPRFTSIAPFFFSADGASAQAKDESPQPWHDFPRPGRPIVAVVRGATLQETLERNDRLYETLARLSDRHNILAVDSLRSVLPSLSSQQASLERLRQLDLSRLRRALDQASRASGFQPTLYAPFLQSLEALKAKAGNPEYILYRDDASPTLIQAMQRFATRREDGYSIATVIYPKTAGFRPADLDDLSTALRQGLPGITLAGDPLIEQSLSRLVKFNLAIMIALSILIILLALLLHFRSPRYAALTFVPVLAEIIWLCGAMALSGLTIHFFTVLVMPLALCLAMDNSLQLTQYYRDRQPCSVRHAMLSVGRVAMLTCSLLGLLLGTACLSHVGGLQDLGLTVLFAGLAILSGTVMLLPALLQLFGRDQSLFSIMVLDEEIEE